MLPGPIAAGESPRIWRTSHTLTKDNRIVKDRLHARNNRDHEDYSFLNAVGAVWPEMVACTCPVALIVMVVALVGTVMPGCTT